MGSNNNDDNWKKFKELDRMRKCLDDVEKNQDDFRKSQDEMEEDTKELKSMMSQFMGGANPPFNPMDIQSPKTLEGGIFPIHEFSSMHKKP